MNNFFFNKVKARYTAYVDSLKIYKYDNDVKESIGLKIKHIDNVMKEISDIYASEDLPEDGLEIAIISALLHDIGRFEQYIKYRTFFDLRSEDHGELGLSIMILNNLLDDLDAGTADIIKFAVKYHNKLAIPVLDSFGNNDSKVFYTKMLRDADKLDIWRVVIDNYSKKPEERVKSVGLGFKESNMISEDVCHEVIAGGMVKNRNLKYLNDFKILQMGWVFDLNFKHSFEEVAKRDYLRSIYNTLPKNYLVKKVFDSVNDYVLINANLQ